MQTDADGRRVRAEAAREAAREGGVGLIREEVGLVTFREREQRSSEG